MDSDIQRIVIQPQGSKAENIFSHQQSHKSKLIHNLLITK
jgi:hypothetical protein